MGDLSSNFSRKEFACHCGCGFDDVSLDLVNHLQNLRDVLGEPIHILSGCRCEKKNHDCDGVKNSQHLLGKAADIRVDSLSPKKLSAFIDGQTCIYFGGIGVYSSFVHVDVRQGKARWKG